MKQFFVLLLVICLLCGCGKPAKPQTDSTQVSTPAEIPSATQAPSTAQTTAPTQVVPPTQAPAPTQIQTGLVTKDGKNYYVKPDGTYARGKVVIDDIDHFFASSGEEVLVVNPWHYLPYNYTPNLVTFYDFAQYSDGSTVDEICLDPLLQMLNDCRSAGYEARIISSYRRQSDQESLYNNKVNYYLGQGYDIDKARERAGRSVAVPGTSEHQLGLAVDLIDKIYPYLNEGQEKTPAQKWLLEHCWEYGFILRYPSGKTAHTGIIYEPWHYRYVGKELAKELKDTGLCLEEYFETLN